MTPMNQENIRKIFNKATLVQLASSFWFSYLMLFLLQAKRVFSIWRYKDLTSGDTAGYFLASTDWYRHWNVNIVWSPLYTAFLGTLRIVFQDAYFIIVLHRLIIVFALGLLILLLMRRLLPAGIAWLTAAWWVSLPINFNSLYEVHLFAVVPVAIACVVALLGNNAWIRGSVIAILVATTLLVRNETSISTMLFGLACLAYEIAQIRKARSAGTYKIVSVLTAYLTPAGLAICLFLLFYSRSTIRLNTPEGEYMVRAKHTLNVCQIYAYGYQQRYSDWQGSPWTDCHSLMIRDFDTPEPSLMEAFLLNRNAIIEHFLWNIELIPSGLQVLLFDATSGQLNPDYADVRGNVQYPLWLGILAIFVLAIGATLFVRNRAFWWNYWVKDRGWGWLLLLAVSMTVCVVIIMQRPRPSYMFNLSIFLMALIGMSVFILAYQLHLLDTFTMLAPIIMIIVLLTVPGYYPSNSSDMALFIRYERLEPFQRNFDVRNTIFVSPGYGTELCQYFSSRSCTGLDYRTLKAESPEKPLAQLLSDAHTRLFYADESMLADPDFEDEISQLDPAQWRLLGYADSESGRWMLWQSISQQ
jgi:Ca2+/Na+ antiporter